MAISVPRIIPRHRLPTGGHRATGERLSIGSLRTSLLASLPTLSAYDQEFARSLLSAKRPTTRQLAFMEVLIYCRCLMTRLIAWFMSYFAT